MMMVAELVAAAVSRSSHPIHDTASLDETVRLV
jgi:hypothetical protein